MWQFYFRLMQGVSATKLASRGQGSGSKMPNQVYMVPDWQTRINALIQAFKVFGEYAPTKVNVEGDILAGKTDDEKKAIVQETEAFLKKMFGAAKGVAESDDDEAED